MKDYVHAYTDTSETAKKVAEALGWPLFTRRSPHPTPTPDSYILNWGDGDFTSPESNVVNNGSAIEKAVNKRMCFIAMERHGVSVPRYTSDHALALDWLRRGSTIYVRHNIVGFDGAGLEIVEPGPNNTLPLAPLYVKGLVNVIDEYRLTCFKGSVLVTQKKVPISSLPSEKINFKMRTSSGGWGFDVVDSLPMHHNDAALAACEALRLDFGGVDLVVCTNTLFPGAQQAFVLEVNTAPFLTPHALTKFVSAVRKDQKAFVEEMTQVEDKTEYHPCVSSYRDIVE